MNTFLCLLFLSSFVTCIAIRCYECNGAVSSSCNDPFNSGGSSVGISADIYTSCKKRGVSGVITREGENSCTATGWTSGTGTLCCSTDRCNAAQRNYHPFGVVLLACLAVAIVLHRLV